MVNKINTQVGSQNSKPTIILDKENLWKMFCSKFKEVSQKSFQKTDDSIKNLKPLFYYYLGDIENFVKCENVVKIIEPDLSKGLLVIGGYGNGKSTYFKTFEQIFKNSNFSFKCYNANDVVSEFEKCNTPFDKTEFGGKYYMGNRYFDDVFTERVANNFGKFDLFKDILEVRYANRKPTFLSCNYLDGYPNDIQAVLNHFGERYGGRVHDRLFDMFNIVQFTGKSFRV